MRLQSQRLMWQLLTWQLLQAILHLPVEKAALSLLRLLLVLLLQLGRVKGMGERQASRSRHSRCRRKQVP